MLLAAAAMLIITGLLAVYTSSFAVGYHEYGDTNYFVGRQAIFGLLGVCALIFFMRMDYNRLRAWSVPMLLLAFVGLVFVLLPGVGVERNGATRWLILGPVSVQPSEFAKLAVIVYIAAWLASRGKEINQFSLGFVPFVLLLGIVGGLIMAEPDMGTTIIVFITASTLFFVAGAPLSHLALLIGVSSVISYGVVMQRDYQLDRLALFVNPDSDPQGGGFQIIQLLTALGSGGPLGEGWGEGRQKFYYVPGAHTDGVFAILGEELGFFGLMAIMGLFAFFIYRAALVTIRSRDRFSMLLCVGVIAWISAQTLINIGGITRTIPLTGVPLPFLSYGGSSLIMLMAAVGVLLSVSRYAPSEARPARPRASSRGKTTARRPAYSRGPA
jgi:cell division protein FtsW